MERSKVSRTEHADFRVLETVLQHTSGMFVYMVHDTIGAVLAPIGLRLASTCRTLANLTKEWRKAATLDAQKRRADALAAYAAVCKASRMHLNGVNIRSRRVLRSGMSCKSNCMTFRCDSFSALPAISSNITSLDLSHCKISFAPWFLQSIRNAKSITDLNLSSTCIGIGVAEIVESCSNLRALNISDAGLETDGVDVLARAIQQNTGALSSLNILGNRISTAQADHLHTIKEQKGIVTLCGIARSERRLNISYLSGRYLSVGCCALLTSELIGMQTLVLLDQLDLEDTHTRYGGQPPLDFIQPVACMLMSNTTIRVLNVADNNLDKDAMDMLFLAVMVNETLVTLNILKNNIDEAQLDAWIKVKEQKRLVSLCGIQTGAADASFCCAGKLTPADSMMIAMDIETNAALTALDLNSTCFYDTRRIKQADNEARQYKEGDSVQYEGHTRRVEFACKAYAEVNVLHGVDALVNAICSMPSLTSVNVLCTYIGNDGQVEKLLDIKKERSFFLSGLTEAATTVDFSGMHLTDRDARLIALDVQDHAELMQLNLSRIQGVAASGSRHFIRPIADMLETNTRLTELNVSGDRMDPAAMQILSRALHKNCSLTKLDISRNHLHTNAGLPCKSSEDFIRPIARLLMTNTSIRELNIAENDLNVEAGRIFSDGMMDNRTLTKLTVGAKQFEIYTVLEAGMTCGYLGPAGLDDGADVIVAKWLEKWLECK